MSRVELARQAMQSRAAMRPRGPSLTTARDLTVADSIAARLYRPTTDPASHESPDAARATAATFEQFGGLIRGGAPR